MFVDNKILPYFPLGVFLLPGEDMPLRIFEPRYIQLIEESREEGYTFAMPFVIDDQIQDYGCEVKLQQVVAENPSGRMVVTIEGVSVVHIESFTKQMDGKLYAGGKVNIFPDPSLVTDTDLTELIVRYRKHFKDDFLNDARLHAPDLFELACALNLSSEEKYKFITMNNSVQQEQFLLKQMKYLMLIRQQEQLLGNEFGLN